MLVAPARPQSTSDREFLGVAGGEEELEYPHAVFVVSDVGDQNTFFQAL